LRMERDCSLSSTHRIVLLGFIRVSARRTGAAVKPKFEDRFRALKPI
jgi:hypothetical protein